MEMKAQGHVVGPGFMATLLNPLESQMIPSTDALLSVKNFVHFHVMT